MNLKHLRAGQHRAFTTCITRLSDGEPTTAIVLPTRYGKSDLMRLVALEARRLGLISGAFGLAPGRILRDQLVKTQSLIGMAQRYDIDSRQALLARAMYDAWEMPFTNDEYLIACTFELATRRIDRFADIADSMRYRHGKPLLFLIDECHEASQEKRRGEFVAKLLGVDAMFILVTATPVRADGEIIPGFKRRVLDEADARRFVVTDAGDGVHNKIDVYEGKKELVVLEADHITTFREAWNEKPSPLCHLSREVIDVDLRQLDGEGDTAMRLSEAPLSVARRCLGKAIRDHRVIEKAVEIMIDQLERIKRVNPKCAAIIFTGNDDPADAHDNAHAKLVKRIIESTAPRYSMNLDVKIATMKTEDGDDKAAKTIEAFVGTDTDNGRGDVLIVKQMGGRGLDAPRVKVVLDLSSVRTVASVVQRIMRCATPYKGITIGTVITMADPLMEAIWKQQVADEGGDRGEWHSGEMELTDTYLKEKSDPEEQAELFIHGADLSIYDDSHGLMGDMALRLLVEQVCNAFPELATNHTKPEIQRRLHGAESMRRVYDHTSVDQEIIKLREDIAETIKELAGAYPGKDSPFKDAWVERYRRITNRAKQAAGIDPAIELKHITSIKSLRNMIDALATYSQEEFV